jgi:hypothetical protein
VKVNDAMYGYYWGSRGRRIVPSEYGHIGDESTLITITEMSRVRYRLVVSSILGGDGRAANESKSQRLAKQKGILHRGRKR